MVVKKPKEFLLQSYRGSRCESQGLNTLIEQSQWGQKCTKNAGKKLTRVQIPYALTAQPMPPLLSHCTLFLFYKEILKLIRPIVDIVNYANEILEYSTRFYECSIRSLEKCAFY